MMANTTIIYNLSEKTVVDGSIADERQETGWLTYAAYQFALAIQHRSFAYECVWNG